MRGVRRLGGPRRAHRGRRAHAGPVIGVAKTRFAGADAIEVVRGDSARPLYVTAVGIDAAHAARCVTGMAGEFRIPALLQRVDALARGHAHRI